METEKWDFYAENDEYAFMSTRISKKSEIPSKEEGKPAVKLENLTLQAYLSLTLGAYGISVDENDGNTITIYYADTFGSGFYYCYYKDGSGKYGYMLLVKESLNYFYIEELHNCADGDHCIEEEHSDQHPDSADAEAVLLIQKIVNIHHAGHTPILLITKVINTMLRIEILARMPMLKKRLFTTCLPR